jgi:hypothetical protein
MFDGDCTIRFLVIRRIQNSKKTKTGPSSWNALRLAMSYPQTFLHQRAPFRKSLSYFL